jgi:hypothetical protein
MDDTICYLNTDLDLASPIDLFALLSALEAAGLPPLHSARREDGRWHATCETAEQFSEPEQNIAAILAVIEALPYGPRAVWSACTRRELNVGFDCGAKPWAFNQALSSDLLRRIAAVGLSLRVTLYPPKPEEG